MGMVYCQKYLAKCCLFARKSNITADRESRENNHSLKWMINKQMLQDSLHQLRFQPDIDLFASRVNNQFTSYAAYRPDPNAIAVDAFTMQWTDLKFYAFPPFSVVSKVLSKICQEKAEGILVLPNWPTQSWFAKAMQMLVQPPVHLKQRRNLLILPPKQMDLHPLHAKLSLIVCHLSASIKTSSYLLKTKVIRGVNSQLLLSFVKPNAPVSKDTIARWIKTVLQLPGIDLFPKNYVSLVPPESERLHVIKDILGHMSCEEPVNIPATCLQSETSIDSNLRSQLRNAKELNFCIVVHCTEKLHRIFLLAKEYDLLGPRYRWFLTSFMEINWTLKELPENLISIELNHNNGVAKLQHGGCGHPSYLNDAFMLVTSLESELRTDFARLPTRR
ncbi:Hypothetical predicted protein [Paramuricea clavata]|uniref:Uncharacterized protein n=1 Tax=Paramuricea clavata TaxID=317549 RepID=A0A6S7HRN2_PARCT|nr:Hypothetical predicted protein [Paramuricea clavata]